MTEHFDKLGNELAVGDCVAVPVYNHLRIGRITSLTPKMVRIIELTAGKYKGKWIKYAKDLVVVDGPGVTMLVLQSQE
jgi:hypothetical protein